MSARSVAFEACHLNRLKPLAIIANSPHYSLFLTVLVFSLPNCPKAIILIETDKTP